MGSLLAKDLEDVCSRQVSNFLTVLKLGEGAEQVEWAGMTVQDVTRQVEFHYSGLVQTLLKKLDQSGEARGTFLQRPPITDSYEFTEGLPKGLREDPDFIQMLKDLVSWRLRFEDVMLDWKAYPANQVQMVKLPSEQQLGALGDPEFWEAVVRDGMKTATPREVVDDLKRWVGAGLALMVLRPHIQAYTIPVQVKSSTFRQELYRLCQSLGIYCDFKGLDWVVLSRDPFGLHSDENRRELMFDEVMEIPSMQLALQSKEELLAKAKGPYLAELE